MPPFYLIEHNTRYDYASTVSTSQHVAYLQPRALPRQRIRQHDLRVDPAPSSIVHRIDYFGNAAALFTLLTPHDSLLVSSHSMVEMLERSSPLAAHGSPPWEEARDALRFRPGAALTEAAQFAWTSPYIALAPELERFARESFAPGRPLLEAAIDLMHRIHDGFTFDPKATTITTPVSRVLEERHGVCQDFAHLQISCLRSLGLAARYVSGYLLTDPPPGQPRLIGADASHAWLSVHCPRHGWVDLDPTNALLPDVRHITLGWGRDYGDVSPLRGVMLGGAEHTLSVGVSVLPVDEAAFLSADARG
jgi:transglutaminase-like putative cysteine protease